MIISSSRIGRKFFPRYHLFAALRPVCPNHLNLSIKLLPKFYHVTDVPLVNKNIYGDIDMKNINEEYEDDDDAVLDTDENELDTDELNVDDSSLENEEPETIKEKQVDQKVPDEEIRDDKSEIETEKSEQDTFFKFSESISKKDKFDWGKVKQEIFGDFGKQEIIHDVKKVSFVPEALPDEHTIPKDFDVYTDDPVLEYANPISAWIPPVTPRPLPKIHYNGSVTAVGRRKRAVANVILAPGSGNFIINSRHWMYYFKDWPVRCVIIEPLLLTETLNRWDIMVNVKGGGLKGQAGAIRLAISRALVKYDPELKPPLSGSKLLTRDPREVERKKVGRHKARRGFQWVKR